MDAIQSIKPDRPNSPFLSACIYFLYNIYHYLSPCICLLSFFPLSRSIPREQGLCLIDRCISCLRSMPGI